MVGIPESDAVALDGLHHLVDGCILSHNLVLQRVGHIAQTLGVALGHALYGHSRHARHHIGYFLLGYGLSGSHVAGGPLLIELLQFVLQGNLPVAVACSQLVVLVAHGRLLLQLDVVDFLLLLGH